MPEPVARAGVVNLLGGACGSLVGLVLAALVGRTLGAEGAGTYFVAVAVFLIASNVLELGADTGLVRFVSAAVATGRTGTVPALVIGAVRPVLVVGVVFVGLVAVGVASGVNPTDFSGRQLVGGAGIAGASAGTALALSLTRGLGDPVAYPLLQNVTLPLLRLTAVALVVGLVGASATDVVVAWMLPTLVVAALAGLVARCALRRRTEGHGREPADVRAFWGFSASRGVAAAIEIALEWIDVLIVAALTSAEAAGVYAVVTRAARAGEVVQQAARIAVGPQLSAALARGDLLRVRRLHGLVTAAMIWVAWPFYVVVAVFAEAVLGLFGPGFDAGATSLRVLVGAMAVSTAAGTVQTIVLMGGRSLWQLADKAGALVLTAVLTVALVPEWGIEGAAVAWAVTIVVDTVVVVWQVRRLVGVRPIGTYAVVAAALSTVGVGGPCLAGRAWFGSSLTVLLSTTAVAVAGYLAVSVVLRDRLGLTRLSE